MPLICDGLHQPDGNAIGVASYSLSGLSVGVWSADAMASSSHSLLQRFLQRIGFKRVPDSEFVIGRFRATGEPCTLAQARDLEKEVGWNLLDHVEYFEGEELRASLGMYLDNKPYGTRH